MSKIFNVGTYALEMEQSILKQADGYFQVKNETPDRVEVLRVAVVIAARKLALQQEQLNKFDETADEILDRLNIV